MGKTRPPELSSDKLASLEITRVTGGLMVVTAGKDGVTERVLRGDIDMTFVHEDMVIIFPV